MYKESEVVNIRNLRPKMRRNYFWRRLKGAWNVLLGRAIVIKPLRQADFVAGNVTVTMGGLLNRVSINGRDFFFTPSGEFDGTGMSVCGKDETK